MSAMIFKIFLSVCVVPVVFSLIPEKDTLSIPLRRFKRGGGQIINALDFETYDLHKKHHKANTTNDTISLFRYLDNEYYAEIVVGHPGQKLKVSFDTAWSLSWLISSECNSWTTPGCWYHNKYDHDKSSEYVKDGRPYISQQGKLKLKGFYSYDNISFAHTNVTNQSFVEMVNVPYSFLFNKADGILGLGLKIDDYNPFFYNQLSQKKIKKPIFSIFLSRDRQSKKGGSIELGFINERHIHVFPNKTRYPITYLRVDPGQYWQFQVDKIFLDPLKPQHQDVQFYCSNGCKGIVDTSSNAIAGPTDDIKSINKLIKASAFYMNKYTVNCDTVNKLPRIGLVLAGQYFNLSGPDYITKMSYGPSTICLSAFEMPESGIVQKFWTIGGAFLAKYYSIYNIQDRTIGFVRAA